MATQALKDSLNGKRLPKTRQANSRATPTMVAMSSGALNR